MIKGKVVLIPFPFDDLSSSKVRPAVCLTDRIAPYDHVVLAFISSQITSSPHPTDLILEPTDADFRATGLRVRSVIRVHRMMTATTQIIVRQLGQLSPGQQGQLAEKLRVLFGL